LSELIIGHGNSVHDSAFALVRGDDVWAESVERHTQCKRALGQMGATYSARAMIRALRQFEPAEPTRRVLLRNTWATDDEGLAAMRSALGRPPAAGDGYLPWTAAASAMDATTQAHLAWIAAGLHPMPFVPSEEPGAHPIAVSMRPRLRRAPKLPEVEASSVIHHLAHAANAAFTSPFRECVVMVVDGSGEHSAYDFYAFSDGELKVLSSTSNAHSLGWLFGVVTELCGFSWVEGEEWKVMGLAASGRPHPEVRRFFDERTRIEGLTVELAFGPRWPEELEPLLGAFRDPSRDEVLKAAHLARNFQDYFSDCIITLARNARALGISENLAYSGGCALNSSANGRLVRESGFRRLHVPCAPADDGNALGAALYERQRSQPFTRRTEPMSPYLGSEVNLEELEHAIALGAVQARRYEAPEALCEAVAALLAEQRIIAWMQGRAEFGPRALGNRSILADPRPAQMREWINARVKFREEYRPLAPSILHEHGPAWFDPYEESPYMERALPFRPEVRARVPAVVHGDGSGRLQTVKQTWNPLFHGLIDAFYRRTGIPLLVNTSFNVMGRPIVHSVADALTVFHTTGLDALVIGPYVLERERRA
jgi:carbamoyltransferase